MKFLLLLAGMAAAGTAMSAPEVQLSGRIVDHAKQPLGNCAVALTRAGLKTATQAANGTFALTGPLPMRQEAKAGTHSPELNGSRLSFSVVGSRQPVQISIHDAQGGLVAWVWSGEKDEGRYVIDGFAGLPGRNPLTPNYVRLRIGDKHRSLRLPWREQTLSGRTAADAGAEVLPMPKSAAGALDSLTVACPDFPVKKFPVNSYSGNLGDVSIRRPNIILFMADDLGWMDLGFQGSRYYLTPQLDKLAAQSTRFPNAYAHPLCSPTRAAVLAGKEPARMRLTTPAGHLDPLSVPPVAPKTCAADRKVCEPQSAHHMESAEFTIAEALKEKGYRTAFFGKWHLGKPDSLWPEAQGFDVDVGLPDKPGPCSYFDPYCVVAPRLPSRKKGEYIVDRLTDDAMAYLDGHKEAPFFMCLWQFGVHAPFQAKPEITAQYAGKVDPRGKQNYPVMAAMIQSVDESMGRLRKKLADLALDTNTILVFYSDNGGNMYDSVQPGEPNPFPTDNFPLRMGKGNAYEGGVRVPLLIHWPGVTEPGSVDSSLVNETDFYPTFLGMAGITSPAKQALDGYSLAEHLRSGKKPEREEAFCHFPHTMPAPRSRPVTWMRKGDWKLLRFYGEGPDRADKYELYHLGRDIGEAQDVAALNHEVVRTMSAAIQGFLTRTHALTPVLNPNYKP